jgi:hypothetical protein
MPSNGNKKQRRHYLVFKVREKEGQQALCGDFFCCLAIDIKLAICKTGLRIDY